MTQPKPHSLARAAIAVAGVTVLARVVGFGRVIVFAHTGGPSCLGDAYYTANTIPNILFDVVAGGALSTVAVPLLAGRAGAADDDTADRTASALLTWTLLVLLPVLLVAVLFAGPIVDLLVGRRAAARDRRSRDARESGPRDGRHPAVGQRPRRDRCRRALHTCLDGVPRPVGSARRTARDDGVPGARRAVGERRYHTVCD